MSLVIGRLWAWANVVMWALMNIVYKYNEYLKKE